MTTTFPMPSPRHPFGRNGDGAVVSGPVAERLLRTTRAARAGYDENPFPRRGRDAYDPRSVEEPDSFRTRKAAAQQGFVTPEESGLDTYDDAELCDAVTRRIAEAGASDQERGDLERILARLTNRPSETGDADPPEQPSVATGTMRTDDPDVHLRASASARDRGTRHAMDSLRADYARGRISAVDYDRLSEQYRRYGRPTAAGAASFARLFPDAANIRNGY
jgi:hypothetical protein